MPLSSGLRLASSLNENSYVREIPGFAGKVVVFDDFILEPEKDTPRRVEVIVPPAMTTDERRPVVYMNDGNNVFEKNGYGHPGWNVHLALSRFAETGELPPPIIVAVHPIDRSEEYLHVIEFAEGGRRKGRGITEYADYLVRLKSFIDASFPTLSDARSTTIAGSSHGGLAAFLTGTAHPSVFGNAGCMSSSFWAGGVFDIRDCELGRWVRKHVGPGHGLKPRLWIDWGSKRGFNFHNGFIEAQSARWSERLATMLQEDHGYVLNEDLFVWNDLDGGHDENSWSRRFPHMLRAFS
jgi:predicted alpha/beta superfamily hydrolase